MTFKHIKLNVLKLPQFINVNEQSRRRTRAAWVLRRVFSIAVRQCWLIKNPFNCGDPLILISAECRRERILTKQEEILMLKACETYSYRSRIQPILIFLLDTGCQLGQH